MDVCKYVHLLSDMKISCPNKLERFQNIHMKNIFVFTFLPRSLTLFGKNFHQTLLPLFVDIHIGLQLIHAKLQYDTMCSLQIKPKPQKMCLNYVCMKGLLSSDVRSILKGPLAVQPTDICATFMRSVSLGQVFSG